MNRQKKYRDGTLKPQGWRLLAKLVEDVLGHASESANGHAWKDGGEWGFDTLDDFLCDVNPRWSDLHIYFKEMRHLRLFAYDDFAWSLERVTKAEIVRFEREADAIITAHWSSTPPKPLKDQVVFIGHGRSPDWRDLKDHLVDKHGIRVEAYETGSRSGHSIRDVLEDMLEKSSLGILVHTPEDELADGTFNTRPNVIHETGLFQGRLGFAKAIVALKTGTQEFSNLAGIQQIRYSEIRQVFGDVLAWIKREKEA